MYRIDHYGYPVGPGSRDWSTSEREHIPRIGVTHMSCPTCDHTMKVVASGLWWCARCGTLTFGLAKGNETIRPVLVDRCRDFAHVALPLGCRDSWRRMGISESITVEPRDTQRSFANFDTPPVDREGM